MPRTHAGLCHTDIHMRDDDWGELTITSCCYCLT